MFSHRQQCVYTEDRRRESAAVATAVAAAAWKQMMGCPCSALELTMQLDNQAFHWL